MGGLDQGFAVVDYSGVHQHGLDLQMLVRRSQTESSYTLVCHRHTLQTQPAVPAPVPPPSALFSVSLLPQGKMCPDSDPSMHRAAAGLLSREKYRVECMLPCPSFATTYSGVVPSTHQLSGLAPSSISDDTHHHPTMPVSLRAASHVKLRIAVSHRRSRKVCRRPLHQHIILRREASFLGRKVHFINYY